ncbi:hypothetical protein [uncultured Tenacibaculum sp.]|uniref:hypothetical protein n=1 Tax=uncultured Tenacibaculum sp. TaxID=174713 RepID=UPI00262B234B|nr:hypothetical protein [uncultured Tenacibaculum sp.]
MSCCGQKRIKLKEYYQNNKLENSIDTSLKTPKKTSFKYIGDQSLLVQGAISGNFYQFSSSNTVIEVLEVDAAALYAEPLLRNISI